MPITRRTFVEGVAVTAASLTTLDALADETPDLVEVEGTDPKAMVAAALAALGGMSNFVKRGDYVVIKPNAGFANPPAWGTTTHPDTVVAVAKACLEAKAKQVMIVEFPLGKGERCLERCGLTAALASVPEVKVKILAAKDDFKQVKVGGIALQTVELAKALLSADVLINVPAAKAHDATGVSLGLKNAMGLIWNRKALHDEMDLHQAVADLGRVIKPNLTILDATRALLTNGPAGPGETATPGRLVAGRNVVSVDAYGLSLARFNLKSMTIADVRHLALAEKAGLGSTDLSKLKVKKVKT